MSLSDNIKNVIESYRSFSLKEAEAVKLMKRVDTKYVIRADDAFDLLNDMRQDYHVLEIESQRAGTYISTYYDTCDRRMYHAHVTNRLPRYKVRVRSYSQNGLKFFEVKQKNNKRLTSKQRISITESISESGIEAIEWLSQQTPFSGNELTPSLISSFERITLINDKKTERVTLDFNLYYRTLAGEVTPVFDKGAIVELKQEKTADSKIKDYLRNKGIRPARISKYCAGLLFTGSEIAFKLYKPKYSQFIKKIQYEPINSICTV